MLIHFFLISTFFQLFCYCSELKGSTEGDQDPWFQNCDKLCYIESSCNSTTNNFERTKSLELLLTFWDCDADCKYVCTRKHNQFRQDKGLPIVQYYGKWPFVRIFGFQEIASSIFSLGNIIPHALAAWNYRKDVPRTYYLRNIFLANAILGCFTWTFSAIFHCRDVALTEILDYSFASLTLMMGSFCATLRVFELRDRAFYGVSLFFLVWLFQHWRYMFFVEFDYGYNMNIGILNGFYQFLIWTCWYIFKGRFESNPENNHKVVVAYGLMGFAGTMELFDFPPIFEIFDPHSLWHLGTIPSFFILWDFFIQDSIYEEKKEAKKRHHIV